MASRTFASWCFLLAFAWAGTVLGQSTTYTWSDIDCRQSPIEAWPGLKCRTTNVVTTEGNIGAYRRWAAFGTTPEGYVHIFFMEALNSFSYLTTEDTAAAFLKWMYERGQFASDFSPISRYHDSDFLTFKDNQQGQICVGFRRMGAPHRGGYQSLLAGIMCPPAGKRLTDQDIARFIDRVRAR